MKSPFPISRLLVPACLAILIPQVHAAGSVVAPPVGDGLLLHLDAARGVEDSGGKLPEIGGRVFRWTDMATDLQGDNVALPVTADTAPYYLRGLPELNGGRSSTSGTAS